MKIRKNIYIDGSKFEYSLYSKNSDKFVLIIPGWQSTQDIFGNVINGLKSNVIIFDYPGIGRNSSNTWNYIRSDYILRSFIKEIVSLYDIGTVVGISAGTAFSIRNRGLFRNDVNIVLLSPQLTINLMDRILYILFRLIHKIEIIFGLNIYNRLVNIGFVKSLWASVVGKDSRKNETIVYIKRGMQMSAKLWTIQQFIDLIQNKKYISQNPEFVTKVEKISILVGDKDNLFDKDGFVRLFGLSLYKKIQYLSSNHVMELEATDSLTKYLNKIII